jgi:hypothetical protein
VVLHMLHQPRRYPNYPRKHCKSMMFRIAFDVVFKKSMRINVKAWHGLSIS